MVQRAAGNNDLGGWAVAVLFVLFLISVVVHCVASVDFPAMEADAAADSRGIPLPAGPHRPAPILTR